MKTMTNPYLEDTLEVARVRNRSLIKAFGTREESPGDRGGTSYSGHFSAMVNHIVVPPTYVARDLIWRATHHIKGI